MKTAVIHRPSGAARSMVARKAMDKALRDAVEGGRAESMGICQGTVLEIVAASDIAEKTADVMAGEISGSCPQHMTCLVVIGKASAVTAAVDAIKAMRVRGEER